MTTFFIAGGAGFIGSTLAHRLLARNLLDRIVIFDNLSVGRYEHIQDIDTNPRVRIYIDDIKNLSGLTKAMEGCDVVYHFASNADISKAETDPTIDFWEGTYLTQNILEAMRLNRIKKIIYASGSGVYGNYGYTPIEELFPFRPVTSTYGASKQAGEALIAAYCHMFDMKALVYRFANVIGRKQTHGIVSDLIARLQSNPSYLEVRGDGTQLKAYVHVDDILSGIFITDSAVYREKIVYYNISSETSILVKDIVEIVLQEMGLQGITEVHYGDVPGGWKGDIPVVFLNAQKIKRMGWKPSYSSREAIRHTAKEILGK